MINYKFKLLWFLNLFELLDYKPYYAPLECKMVVLLLQHKGFEETKPVIEALKGKGLSPIGAAGFCWGGEYLILYP